MRRCSTGPNRRPSASPRPRRPPSTAPGSRPTTPSSPPYNEYGVQEIGDEIRGLREQGFTGGFMAWNASCSLTKLEELRPLYEALED